MHYWKPAFRQTCSLRSVGRGAVCTAQRVVEILRTWGILIQKNNGSQCCESGNGFRRTSIMCDGVRRCGEKQGETTVAQKKIRSLETKMAFVVCRERWLETDWPGLPPLARILMDRCARVVSHGFLRRATRMQHRRNPMWKTAAMRYSPICSVVCACSRLEQTGPSGYQQLRIRLYVQWCALACCRDVAVCGCALAKIIVMLSSAALCTCCRPQPAGLQRWVRTGS